MTTRLMSYAVLQCGVRAAQCAKLAVRLAFQVCGAPPRVKLPRCPPHSHIVECCQSLRLSVTNWPLAWYSVLQGRERAWQVLSVLYVDTTQTRLQYAECHKFTNQCGHAAADLIALPVRVMTQPQLCIVEEGR